MCGGEGGGILCPGGSSLGEGGFGDTPSRVVLGSLGGRLRLAAPQGGGEPPTKGETYHRGGHVKGGTSRVLSGT